MYTCVMYTYINMYAHVYIYIYIYREREIHTHYTLHKLYYTTANDNDTNHINHNTNDDRSSEEVGAP